MWQFAQLSGLPEKPTAFSGVRAKMASPRWIHSPILESGMSRAPGGLKTAGIRLAAGAAPWAATGGASGALGRL
ncbi:hypothetical protein D3C80_1657010 [compost metagenome]